MILSPRIPVRSLVFRIGAEWTWADGGLGITWSTWCEGHDGIVGLHLLPIAVWLTWGPNEELRRRLDERMGIRHE